MKKGPSGWSIYRPNRLKSGHFEVPRMGRRMPKSTSPIWGGGGGYKVSWSSSSIGRRVSIEGVVKPSGKWSKPMVLRGMGGGQGVKGSLSQSQPQPASPQEGEMRVKMWSPGDGQHGPQGGQRVVKGWSKGGQRVVKGLSPGGSS